MPRCSGAPPPACRTRKIGLKKIFAAKSPDLPLEAEDIVFLLPSKGKMAGEKGANSVLSILTSLAIYRF